MKNYDYVVATSKSLFLKFGETTVHKIESFEPHHWIEVKINGFMCKWSTDMWRDATPEEIETYEPNVDLSSFYNKVLHDPIFGLGEVEEKNQFEAPKNCLLLIYRHPNALALEFLVPFAWGMLNKANAVRIPESFKTLECKRVVHYTSIPSLRVTNIVPSD